MVISMNGIFSALRRMTNHILEPARRTVHHAYIENGDGFAQSRRNILAQNLTYSLSANITGGIFFTGLLLIILERESTAIQNHYIGLITSVQVLAGIFQFFAPMLTRRMKTYRAFGLICRMVHHVINIIFLGALPLLPMPDIAKANLFVVLAFLSSAVINISTPALMRWHVHTCIPEDKRNNWFSIKQLVIPIVTAVVNLGAGYIVDQYDLRGEQLTGILVVRGIALVFVLLELRTHFKIKETPYPPLDQTTSLKDMVVEPMRDKKARAVILIRVIWIIATQIPGQYFNAYLLENLHVDYTFITACSATTIPLMMIMMPIWNKTVRRKGWLSSLWLSTTLYALPAILNCLTFENTWWLYLVSIVYTHVISPGYNLCFENLPYLYKPKTNHTAFLSFYQGVAGVASFLGALIGKYFIQFTDDLTIPLFGHEIVNRQYVWLFTFAGLILLSVIVAITSKNWEKEQS